MSWREAEVKKEAEIMKNVPGWVAGESPYHNNRFAPPGFDLDGNRIRILNNFNSLISNRYTDNKMG